MAVTQVRPEPAGPGSGRLVRNDHRVPLRRADLAGCPVTAVMGRPPITLDAEATLAMALQTFAAYGVRHLVVVDADGRCLGMLSDRAVASWWARVPMTFERVRVRNVVGASSCTVGMRATLADVARVMHAAGTDAVVVVDAAAVPCGVISTSDLVSLLAKPTHT
ncbi:MAG TPA: CBS domain-containing protein [Micromonosporaceae bacterium]|nr:CBS domain-containing protein [Micromonosporaceae bacterium]